MQPFDYANLANAKFIDGLYEQFLDDPGSVDPSWQRFFEGMQMGEKRQGPTALSGGGGIDALKEAYRKYGHLAANSNPFKEIQAVPELKAELYGVSEEAPEVALLKKRYTGSIGIEVPNTELATFIEETPFELSADEKTAILGHLNRAELMEAYIQMKYTGQKRFSLEGGESLIPMLQMMLEDCSNDGVNEVDFGMAHRGRLNVLANIMGKPYSTIFYEFEPHFRPQFTSVSGDVKYHMGYSSDHNGVRVELLPNPSHLESVNPVIEGYSYRKQEINGDKKKVIPFVIHGDSAICAQGVVYETLQLSQIHGYATGGTIHFVINNQVGFTAGPNESKSTLYCTDIGKAFDCPVFHVNGEDPEACVEATRLAYQIRQKFGIDVFIELNCHRKYGHNEGDEPRFTNPLLYEAIKGRETARQLYRAKLIGEGVLDEGAATKLETDFKAELDAALAKAKSMEQEIEPPGQEGADDVETTLPLAKIEEYGKRLQTPPEGFNLHPKLKRIVDERVQMALGEKPLDWGMCEYLAYAGILETGIPVRISGQDSRRGTFAHRHASFIDQKTEALWTPLDDGSGKFIAINSPVSENAVLGFEYGYSLADPSTYNVWEAQYGDFANSAQVVIDQYLISGEQKWHAICSLAVYMPHGYEGGGPEHSSARVERFLQLAANDNMHIVIPSTAAQFFHAIRRQALATKRKPLILFTPKALLRFAPSLSSREELTDHSFETYIDDSKDPKKIKRVILCTGKVYYDLQPICTDETALIRVEQLYPLEIDPILEKYAHVSDWRWVQEEHQNMGAWEYIHPLLDASLPDKVRLKYVGRPPSASTAAGSSLLHKTELETFLKEAFLDDN